MYNPNQFITEEDMQLSKETLSLLKKANKIYEENFNKNVWYGRCIFFSWYCKLATCKFCYRSTLNHQKKHAKNHHRSIGSMLIEALFCKVFHWRIEFLTGGYQQDNDFDSIITYAKLVSQIYGEKIWVNIGWMTKAQIELLRPYVKGICASIETPTPKLHQFVCPHKPIQPYEKMFAQAEGFAKSAAFIVGLGDTDTDIQYWFDFIEKHQLQRITVYALKPIKNGFYTQGPSIETYLTWIAKLRIRFPKLEIIGGTNLRRYEEIGYLIKAGVNAITKFPATKEFGSYRAQKVTKLIESQGRTFQSNITTLPHCNWNMRIDELDIPLEYKQEMKKVLPLYLESFQNTYKPKPHSL